MNAAPELPTSEFKIVKETLFGGELITRIAVLEQMGATVEGLKCVGNAGYEVTYRIKRRTENP